MLKSLATRALRRAGIGNRESRPSSAGPNDVVDRSGLFTKFEITGQDGNPYLTRWYLFRSKGIKIYLHKISQSDADRELHDHPWKFMSILLRGPGYNEHQPGGKVNYYGPYSVNLRPDPGAPHRLEMKEKGDQWTLVFVGPKRREWGFHVPVGETPQDGRWKNNDPSNYVEGAVWVSHEDFLNYKIGKDNWTREPFYYDEKAVPRA